MKAQGPRRLSGVCCLVSRGHIAQRAFMIGDLGGGCLSQNTVGEGRGWIVHSVQRQLLPLQVGEGEKAEIKKKQNT